MRPRTLIALVVAIAAVGGGAGAALAAFSATTASSGNTFSAAAAFGGMRVATGTYNGNSTDNRAIAVAFQPDAVIVKSATAQQAVIRSSAMTGDVTKPMTGATALAPNLVQALTATGFQIGSDVRVNNNGTRYDWIAFKSYANQLSVGSYTGNGTSQAITGLGFSPDYVITSGGSASAVVQRSSAMPTTMRFDETAAAAGGIASLDAGGFTIGSSAEANTNGVGYAYLAFNQVGGLMRQGSYTGNGTDNRNITGLGFQPSYAIVKSSTTGAICDRGLHRPSSLAGGNAQYFSNVANLGNAIQALQVDGFQVGTDCRVNTNANPYYWMAFKDR